MIIFAPNKDRNEMILINQQKLEPSAFKDENHPMHEYAIEYEKGLKEIQKRFPKGVIEFRKLNAHKLVDGINGKGEDVKLVAPTTPSRFPLKTEFKHPQRGTEVWACCLDTPKILPGNLWDLGNRRAISVEDTLNVDIKKDADLAFYLYKISNAVKSGQLYVYDPEAIVNAQAEEKKANLERETAIWGVLEDETQLRKICQGWGIADAGADAKNKKPANTLRFELESLLKANDEKQKRDPSIKGTREFLEEIKITDNVRLRAFIRNALDNSIIVYNPDGRYKVGDKVIIQVPQPEIKRKFDYLCNYMAAPNHSDKLQELLKDVINKDYLDGVTDPKDFRWLAKVSGIEGYYNKNEEQVKNMVYTEFGVA